MSETPTAAKPQAERKEALDYYQPWPYDKRPKIEWPGGAKIALWVAPNIEVYELNPPKNDFRTPWPVPFPPLPGYGIRDYGNRVGHVRQMELLDKYGIRGSISLSTALIDHHPEIIELCAERDWEFFSHGIYNKRMPSPFFETPLQSLLVWHQADTVVLTGGSTSGCIRAGAVESLSRGYRTIVPEQCVADKHESYHFANLTDLMLKYADVVDVDEVKTFLDNAKKEQA